MDWLMTKEEDNSSRLIICFENETEKHAFISAAKKAVAVCSENELSALCGEMPVVSGELNRFRDDEVVQTVLFENNLGEHWSKLVYFLNNVQEQLKHTNFEGKQDVQGCVEEITDEFLVMQETFRDFKKNCTRAFSKKQANHKRTIDKLSGLAKVLQAYELLFEHYITEKAHVQKAIAEVPAPQIEQKEYFNVEWQQKINAIKAKRLMRLREATK